MKTHTGEKSSKCNQCDFVCSQAGNLKMHLKTHGGTKPTKCNQCDYASSYASALKTHMRTHNGEKPFICKQCNYASAYASALTSHKSVHSGIKASKCKQCKYACSEKNPAWMGIYYTPLPYLFHLRFFHPRVSQPISPACQVQVFFTLCLFCVTRNKTGFLI